MSDERSFLEDERQKKRRLGDAGTCCVRQVLDHVVFLLGRRRIVVSATVVDPAAPLT